MAGHGGKRPGAGKPKGAKHKTTLAREAIMKGIFVEGEDLSPLDVLVTVMKQAMKKKNVSLAMHAASLAAPYMHHRLTSSTLKGDPSAPLSVKILDDSAE